MAGEIELASFTVPSLNAPKNECFGTSRLFKLLQPKACFKKRKLFDYKFKNVHISGLTNHFRYASNSAYSFGLGISDIVAYTSILTELLCPTSERIRIQ